MIPPQQYVSIPVPMSEVGLPRLVWWVCHGYKMNIGAGIEYTFNLKGTLNLICFDFQQKIWRGSLRFVCWTNTEYLPHGGQWSEQYFNIHEQHPNNPELLCRAWYHYIAGGSKVLKAVWQEGKHSMCCCQMECASSWERANKNTQHWSQHPIGAATIGVRVEVAAISSNAKGNWHPGHLWCECWGLLSPIVHISDDDWNYIVN